MKRFLRGLMRNPKTSGAGIATLVGVGAVVAANPGALAAVETWTAILAAIGLLVAADGADDPPSPDEE